MAKIFQSDSRYLLSLFASMINDKMATGETISINTGNFSLSKLDLGNLTRKSGLLQRLVYDYPRTAATTWIKLDFAQGVKSANRAKDILNYLRNIPYYTSVSGNEVAGKGLRNAFAYASGLSRKLGSARIIILVDDYEDLSQPINFNRIDEIVALKIYDCYECSRGPDDDKEIYYQISGLDTQKIHFSRVLNFYGNRLDTIEEYHLSGLKHDSVVYSAFEAFCTWLTGGKSIADMLKSANIYKLGIKDLGENIRNDLVSNSNDYGNFLLNRMMAIKQNININSLLSYDLEDELVDTVARNLSGTKESLDSLENLLVANCDMPRWRLLNQFGTGGMASSIEAARILQYNWALLVSEWSYMHWLEPLTYMIELVMYCLYGKILPEFTEESIIFPIQLKLDDFEQMNLEKLAAERNEILIRNKIITNLEARISYEGARFNPVLTLLNDQKEKLL